MVADVKTLSDDSDPFNKNEEPQHTNKQGKPPKNVIANPQAAYSIFKKFKDDSENLAIERARIQGQLDGNPPYSQKKRASMGLGWQSNVNFRESWAIVRATASAIWDMFLGVHAFLDLDLIKKDGLEPSEDYGEIISEEWTDMMLSWDKFDYNLILRIYEMLNFGNGPVHWENEDAWPSKAIKNSNFLFPAKTKSSLGDLNACMLRDEKNTADLFEAIKDEDAAKKVGWNVKQVKKVIVRTYVGELKDSSEEYISSQFESIQAGRKNKDDGSDHGFDDVRIVHVLSEEKDDRRVTHQIIAENDKDENEFLFMDDRRFESMSKAVHMLLFNIGNGLLKSVRGLAHELFSSSDISNRLLNSTIDGAVLSSGLILQGGSGDSNQKIPLMRKGPITIVPEDLKAVQSSSFAPPIGSLVQVRQLLKNIENQNSGVFQKSKEEIDGKPPSATQASIEARKEARFESNQAAWYYSQWETWLVETFRRSFKTDYSEKLEGSELQKRFIKRLIDRGVPEELIDFSKWRIKARRAIGMGSPVEKIALTNWLIRISSRFDERGQFNAFRDAVGVRFGFREANRYMPIESRNKIITSEHGIAVLENNDFVEGNTVPVGTDQFHMIHIPIHFELAATKIDQFRSGQGDIQLIVRCMGVTLEHVQRHIEQLARDEGRKAEVEQFSDMLDQFFKIFTQMREELNRVLQERIRQEEENRQTLAEAEQLKSDREFQLEMRKIELKHAADMKAVEGLNQKRLQQMEAQITISAQKAASDQARKDFEAMKESLRKDLLAEAEVSRKASQ